MAQFRNLQLDCSQSPRRLSISGIKREFAQWPQLLPLELGEADLRLRLLSLATYDVRTLLPTPRLRIPIVIAVRTVADSR